MKDLKLGDLDTAGFSAPALAELEIVLSKYSSGIIEECNRLAGAEALDGRPLEVTAAMVNKANSAFQIVNGISLQKKTNMFLRIGAAAFPILTGVLPNLLDMTADVNFALVILLGAVSLVLVVILITEDFR